MNLADYLSELLGQYEEVSVPGLGYFVRERVNGYYNEKESRFYPPYHKVKFVPQPKDDDTFTQYVADKKNISLASSKYFAEKFVSKLREQALTGKYLFADLGLFYTDQDQLVFKPNDKITDDPAFYGYPPLNIFKQAQQPNTPYQKPSFTEPAPASVSSTPPVQAAEDDQFYEEETSGRKRVNVWMIVLIIITVVALALFGVYKFFPAAFDKLGTTFGRSKADTAVPVYRHEVKPVVADTTKKEQPKDTTAKVIPAPAAVVDTTKKERFEIIENSFRKEAFAILEVTHLKARNVNDAKVLTKEEAPGTRFKVSAGTYPTEAEAAAAKDVLLKAGKIRKDSYILPIKL
ncbi:hypothetical protein KXD93_27485 [Mucilaginibacter sp. BJC16-A38]|uniref:HU domain-containing protein n=1 Tax=Mucilaginibacter phenanthrenivorans TaxID=1234842 RepID=UPI0021586ACF|nr:hypothetical protein [Mucilaginibacter phenanthrenivorans]MCR8561427.1 hypothetical protein [Mucilaginibacter phenanthrenivorans]